MNTFDITIQAFQFVLALAVYSLGLAVILNSILPSKRKLFK